MRKIIITSFITMDGVLQAPGGPEEDPTGGFKWGGWTAPYGDETLHSIDLCHRSVRRLMPHLVHISR